MSETGWSAPAGGLTFDEWREAGRALLTIGLAWQWWVGDWLAYGEGRGFVGDGGPSVFLEVAELLGVTEQHVRNVVQVARAFPPGDREHRLPWTAFHVVAHLPVEQRREWLRRAVDEGMTVYRLRSALQREGVTGSWQPGRAGRLPSRVTDPEAVPFALRLSFDGVPKYRQREVLRRLRQDLVGLGAREVRVSEGAGAAPRGAALDMTVRITKAGAEARDER